MSDKDLIGDAEMAIAQILAKLETDTGTLVDEINLVDTDVTALSDTREMLARRVNINLIRLPGARWYLGSNKQ